MSRKVAVVTGANGMVGSRLCRRLKELGWHVLAVNRTSGAGSWDEVIVADLARDEEVVIPKGVAAIFHLAGKAHAMTDTPREVGEYHAVNTEGTQRMLEAAQKAGVKRFVLFSSVKAMGEGSAHELNETAACQPETPYGKSKLAAERLVLEGGYVSEPVVLRLSMVYGLPGKGNLPRMVEAVANNRFPPLSDVGNKRSMVHVDDVLQASILVAERPEAAGQVYIVTDGRQYSTRQIYVWICQALNKPVPRWSLPLALLRIMGMVGDWIGRLRGKRFMFDSDTLEKLVGSAAYSCTKLTTGLGYRPVHDLRQSLLDRDMNRA